MAITLDLAALKRARASEYAVRFLLGGAITVAAGLIAKAYGPVLGGLFLAFPAIFPASATLLAKHETEKKARAGFLDKDRGRKAAALDARGAALGSLALVCFALLVWRLLPNFNAALTLFLALLAWLGLTLSLWRLSKMRHGKKGRTH